MKKLILSLMLITGSLSFSNDKDRGKNSSNFEELRSRAEISYKQKEKKNLKKTSEKSSSIIPNIFNDADSFDGSDK
ncbi:hypothetical protein [Psychrilyobacter atlanticus]|uniref:hypothetical protein n=1 Tax=Psychrilyobacter atlanticus TaxID=271091 RepID=UPI000416E86E|nr:hypothetical protein [Psychrilyobacter atlanticus]